jgi:hypothetical protein
MGGGRAILAGSTTTHCGVCVWPEEDTSRHAAAAAAAFLPHRHTRKFYSVAVWLRGYRSRGRINLTNLLLVTTR